MARWKSSRTTGKKVATGDSWGRRWCPESSVLLESTEVRRSLRKSTGQLATEVRGIEVKNPLCTEI